MFDELFCVPPIYHNLWITFWLFIMFVINCNWLQSWFEWWNWKLTKWKSCAHILAGPHCVKAPTQIKPSSRWSAKSFHSSGKRKTPSALIPIIIAFHMQPKYMTTTNELLFDFFLNDTFSFIKMFYLLLYSAEFIIFRFH